MQIEVNRKVFLKYLELIDCIVPDAMIDVNSMGMSVLVVDDAHVQLLSLNLPSDLFNSDAIEGFAIDVSKMSEKVKKIKSESISLIKNGTKITLVGGEKRFNTHTIAATNLTVPKIPSLTEGNVVSVDVKRLQEGLNFMDGDSIGLHLNEMLRITSPDDTDESEDTIPYEGLVEQTKESLFSAPYICAFIKLIDGGKIDVSVGNDYPLVLSGNTLGIAYKYILAPRIENE